MTLVWGVGVAAASAGCGAASDASGQTPLVTILLAVIPALGGVAAAWVASSRPRRRR